MKLFDEKAATATTELARLQAEVARRSEDVKSLEIRLADARRREGELTAEIDRILDRVSAGKSDAAADLQKAQVALAQVRDQINRASFELGSANDFRSRCGRLLAAEERHHLASIKEDIQRRFTETMIRLVLKMCEVSLVVDEFEALQAEAEKVYPERRGMPEVFAAPAVYLKKSSSCDLQLYLAASDLANNHFEGKSIPPELTRVITTFEQQRTREEKQRAEFNRQINHQSAFRKLVEEEELSRVLYDTVENRRARAKIDV